MESQSDNWQQVESFIVGNYEKPDIEACKIVYSALASHRIADCIPAWLLPIAPPGSMKTDLLESMRGLPGTHFIDEVTKDTFLSGKVDDPKKGGRVKSASLLHRIGNDGIVISADFSTFSSNEEKNLSAILSQLRRIYDGNYCHEFGTDEHLDERPWSGRLTLLAGATPAIDRHFAVFQLLGERFLRVRWPRVGGVSAAVKAMSHRRELLPAFRQMVRPMLLPVLERGSIPAPHIPDDLQVRIGSVSEIAALARAYVHRDSQSREMSNLPEAESNTRLPQQLAQIGSGWAVLNGRDAIGQDEFALIVRAAFDSIPPVRKKVLLALGNGQLPYSLPESRGVVTRTLEDLASAGLVENKSSYRLSENANCLISQAGIGSLFLPIDSGGDISVSIPASIPPEKKGTRNCLEDLEL